jgi:hypothetical protein
MYAHATHGMKSNDQGQEETPTNSIATTTANPKLKKISCGKGGFALRAASAGPTVLPIFPTDSEDLDILGFRYALPI